MRKMITQSVLICGLMLHVKSAGSQTAPAPPTNADNTSLSFGNLTPVWSWDNGTTTHACSSNPKAGITGWWGPTFTEPTLADNQQNQGTGSTGAVYVPTICAETDSRQTMHRGCHDAAQNGATLVSGVLAGC